MKRRSFVFGGLAALPLVGGLFRKRHVIGRIEDSLPVTPNSMELGWERALRTVDRFQSRSCDVVYQVDVTRPNGNLIYSELQHGNVSLAMLQNVRGDYTVTIRNVALGRPHGNST